MVVETLLACSVAIDFGKLFSSSFGFLSFYTARVKTGPDGLETPLPVCPGERTF
jgi:hypothetical protein